MYLKLDRRSREPLFAQIRDQIRDLVSQGALPPGVRLPPTRDLADSLGVSRAVVVQAYDELAALGTIESSVGRGSFVAPARAGVGPLPAARRAPDWSALLSDGMLKVNRLLSARRVSASSGGGRTVTDFASLCPHIDEESSQRFRHSLNWAYSIEGRRVLEYGDPQGYRPLRALIAREMSEVGVPTERDGVIVTSGSQQAVNLVAMTLLNPGDAVVIQNPTYPPSASRLAHTGAEILPVGVEGDGFDLEAARAIVSSRRVKLMYLMPTCHNPTGLTMSYETRRRIISLAREHNCAVAEDGFSDALAYPGHLIPPMSALDSEGRTLYMGSLSKILFPGIRLGWIAACPELVNSLVNAKRISDLDTSLVLQVAAYDFWNRGYLDQNVRRMRTVYFKRREAVLEAVEEYFPAGTTCTGTRGGLFVWVRVPGVADTESLLPAARARGVEFAPGARFDIAGGSRDCMRLSFSSVPLEEIRPGIRALAEVIRDASGMG
ncbi:MAG: PLP-dependent aminotransferase family protein [Firmicutes bacterium]|jgi:GntR family transcriptional regulator/MocR family aminotransferase|nr:PLP-dependent aminotransferase family protein [Bacillota bacterium]